jgi:hypothetical protein
VNSWIELNALWQIVVFGLLAGAALPALFATAAACFAIVLTAVAWGI